MGRLHRFADFTLDTSAFELRRGAAIVSVEPLVFDLLALLLQEPGVVLSRERLMETVWNGRIVSESTISTAIKSARQALGDTGREQKFIRTIRGRGILFAVAVKTQQKTAVDSEPGLAHVEALPAIYVRPFETLGDAGLEQLSCALRVQTTSILTRIPLLRIAASFPEADQLMDPRELRSRFAVTHILEVRLQRAANTLTADAALTETRDGLQLWAQQFETPASAGAQQVLLHQMIRRIEPRLMQAMATEMRANSSDDSGTHPRADLLQAIVLLAMKGWHRTTFVEATMLIERALEQEPDFALAHAYLALLKALGHRVGLLRDDETVVPAAIAAAERALALESQDSTILGLAGCALADVGQLERAMPILRRAIDLDPQNGHAQTALGAALLTKGDSAAAEKYLSAGIGCSPADSRRSVWGTALALAHLAQGALGEARQAAETACEEDDRLYLPRLALAAVHLLREDQDPAAAAVRDCLRTKPDLSRHEVACVVGKKLGASIWAIAQGTLDGATDAEPDLD